MVRGHSRKDGQVSSVSSGIRKTPPDQSVLAKPWSDIEDKTILHLRTVGWGWMAISKRLPGRRWAACRFRFHDHLMTQYKWDDDKKISLDRSYEKSQPDMWLKVAEQMAAPWRLADAMHQETGKHAFAHQADMSASSEDRSRDAATNLLSQASNLPELRMPIEKDTTLLPSFAEMFSDVPSTHSAPN